MDIFSFFDRSPEKQIQRLRKKVKEPHGDPATRMNAAHKLCEMGTPEALLALLDRFNISVSPSVQDDEEKEQVLSWMVSFGEKAVEPLTTFLHRERQVYWPVKALKQIQPDQWKSTVNQILLHLWEHPPASPEPLVQLIRSLENEASPEIDETVARYLEERDDDVRLAALDYLFASSSEGVREQVLECYLESEDRPRIRSHILRQLVAKGWTVKGYRPRIEETLPESYVLTRDGSIQELGRKP